MRDVDLVADRFVRTASGWIDLASGEPVRLRRLSFADPSSQDKWLERCASLWQVRHPHLVHVVDYGCLGATSAFEALRLPAAVETWRCRDDATARAVAGAVDCLLGQGLSPGRLVWHRVVEYGGRPMLVPDEGTGWPLGTPAAPGRHRRGMRGTPVETERARLARFLRCCGRVGESGSGGCHRRLRGASTPARVPRLVGQVIELLESGRTAEVRQVHLSGPRDLCADVLACAAREARLRGYVPVSTACVAGSVPHAALMAFEDLVRVTGLRHVLLIDWDDGASGIARYAAIRLLLELGTASARPHVILTLHPGTSTTDGELRLTSPASLCRCCADGSPTARPGPVTARASDRWGQAIARASEARSDYGVCDPAAPSGDSATCVTDEEATARRALAACDRTAIQGAGHVRARNRCLEGLRLAGRGRHAAGERLLRHAAAALARRRDDGWAGQATLNLGRLLHSRGRCREAAAAFEQARAHFDRSGVAASSIRATVYLGLVWTDNGRLCEAEAALRAAIIAAVESGSARGHEFARLALARCLVWQRRWDEAEDLLCAGRRAAEPPAAVPGGAATPRLAPGGLGNVTAGNGGCREPAAGCRWEEDVDAGVMAACLASRIAVGRCDLAAAGQLAEQAGTLARQSAEARDLVAAQAAAARVHAEIADIDGLRHLVRQGLREAARAHVPLEAVRLRLLLADGLRRGGLKAEADRMAVRLGRRRGEHLPLLLRLRLEAAARGRLSTEIDASVTSSPLPIAAAPVPYAAPRQVSDGHKVIVADVIDLLRISHDVPDEAAIMDRLALYLRQQMRASSVAFFGAEPAQLVPVASSGSRPFPVEIAARACDAGMDISPADSGDAPEAAVPIRYGGATIGALACRWPADTRPRPDRLEAVLSTAATLAASAVRAALDRRACPQAVLSAEPDLLGAGELIDRLRSMIARAASTPFPILIEGESGTGKELVARAIHRLSPRRERKCHTLNCAALADDLVEAELFGHARGAFTGAVGERAGLFEDADGGTLVLDEVGELSARAQAKLLRALQEGEVRRVGDNVTRSVDVRIVAAANRPLQEEVGAGRFRRDLFYRLAVVRIAVPPLRDRVDDIPSLAHHFWAQATSRTGSRATLSPATVAALARYNWPGNVRELQNVMAALAVSAPRRGTVGPASLPAAITAPEAGACRTTLSEARRAFEIRYVQAALAQAGGRRARAARELGLSRQGFAKVLARLNVDAAGR